MHGVGHALGWLFAAPLIIAALLFAAAAVVVIVEAGRRPLVPIRRASRAIAQWWRDATNAINNG